MTGNVQTIPGEEHGNENNDTILFEEVILCPCCQKRFKCSTSERRLSKKAGARNFEYKCPRCSTWHAPRAL